MGYFDNRENVESYVRMAEGYDGRALIEVLKKHLASGSAVLELGMGPGVDLDILAADYQVTGSDNAETFLERYREANPDANLLLMDAVSLDTDRQFDCIYSNKVLHHLTKSQLAESFRRQFDVLRGDGLLFHTFWYGEGEEEQHGLRFVYYDEASLKEMLDDQYEVVLSPRYTEMEPDDSVYLLLKKRSRA